MLFVELLTFYERGMYLLNKACAFEYQCYGAFSTISGTDEFYHVITALFLDGFVYYILYLYLDNIMPREFGVPKHPLFFLETFKKLFTNKVIEQNEEKQGLMQADYTTSLRAENADVAAEREKVTNGGYPPNTPLIIHNLSKKYPSAEKFSLKNFYLGVESGECFSLLGENGAGKTTAISLLTGLYPPTEGTAVIAGHDIKTEMKQGRLMLGVCPQFNVLWETLTVEEHLLFYTRLKGVAPSLEKEHTAMWLRQLGLTFAKDRLSKDLSGGMKRRVSIGIALVGNPKLVFLDEPTTGLDPASRRHLWTILERARHGRALILTTHSMDEAEVLSNRIGIMAFGAMRCIGTPQHLKSSIGSMYHLKINYNPENKVAADDYAMTVFPFSRLVRTYRSSSEYYIKQSDIQISTTFARMESETHTNGITDWGLNQVGLDEVFQMIVDASHVHG